MSGKSWHVIAADLGPDAGINTRNVRDHFANGHLPVAAATVQALAERQAQQCGEVVERAAEVTVGYVDFCHSIVGTVSRQVATGQVQPTVRDAIAAATVLARFDPGPEMAEERFVEAFAAYHETVADVLHPDQFLQLGQRLEEHPVLVRLADQWEAARRVAG